MDIDVEMPSAKRQRLDHVEDAAIAKSRGSRLFAPFRTIGLVSPTAVPFTSIPLGKTTFQITTSVGQRLQTYDLKRGLSLVFLSNPPCPDNITATCAYRDRVFVAWGSGNATNGCGIWVFKRGKLIGHLEQAPTSHELRKVLVFGRWIVGCGPKSIEVWDNETSEHYTSIELPTTPAHSVEFTSLCTLPTFLNKVFAGRSDGKIDIYNISTGKLVHTIVDDHTSAGGVTCLAAPPALSLLAVARGDGSITIIDVETEDTITRVFEPDKAKTVTSISFRTDGSGAGNDGQTDGVMATASIQSGDITLWDLTKAGKIAGILRSAHETSTANTTSGISNIEFLAGQPVLISSGLDNALRSWVFDQVPFSPIPRILQSRNGHASAITTLKFMPAATDGSEAAGKWLLSASDDRSFVGFSLRKDGQSTELSQGNVRHKAKKQGKVLSDESDVEHFKCPPITGIACSLNRDGGMGAVGGAVWSNPSTVNAEEASMTGWESIVTCHHNDKYARTWFWGRKKAGRWAFETSDHKPVTSVAMTACGTFALIGSSEGSLDMFNLQSGLHRQRFPPKLKPSQGKQLKLGQISHDHLAGLQRAHKDAITGIVVDTMNQTVVSTSLDGQAIFWEFVTGKIKHQMRLESAPIAVRYNSVAGLISVACDDLCIRVIDVETRRVVRELWGCVGQIFDHCFSHDGRWIVTCSMDSVVRTFDLATSHLIDAFRSNTCTAIAFSSTGEFLATAHAGSIGANIWTNKSLYAHISLRQINEEREIVDLTNTGIFQASSQLLPAPDEDTENNEVLDIDEHAVDQLDTALLTLSLLPQSRWQTLLNLETIRQRNKPIEPPQKPKAAPFFLGSALTNGVKETEAGFQNLHTDSVVTESEKSRISRLSSLQPVKSIISTHLDTFADTSHSTDLVAYLSDLSPSAAELDIRSLTMQEMPVFVRAMNYHLMQRRDFELINTWMAVFLKLHGEFVGGVDEIRTAVLNFQNAMDSEKLRLSQSVGWARGVVEFLRSSR